MESSHGKDEGCPVPQEGISQPQTPKTPRCPTPRGLLFSDLGEAHRNITSRQPPKNNHLPKGADENDANIASSQHGALSEPVPSADGGPLTDFCISPIRLTSPSIRMPSPRRHSAILAEILEQKVTQPKVAETVDSSGNTVEKIYDQYTTAADDDEVPSSLNNPSRNHAVSKTHRGTEADPASQRSAATRCGFRAEEALGHEKQSQENSAGNLRSLPHADQARDNIRVNYRHFPAGSLPSEPPSSPPPAIPFHHRRSRSLLALNEGTSSFAESTVSDSQQLLDPNAQAQGIQQNRQPIFRPALRLPLTGNPKDSEQDHHDDSFSEADLSYFNYSNESNGDPFKYDGGHYQAVLRPTKEREVSQALKRLSQVAGPSQTTIFTPDDSDCEMDITEQRDSKPHLGNITRIPLVGRPAGGVFNQAAVHAPQNGPRELKLVLDRKPWLEKGKKAENASRSSGLNIRGSSRFNNLPRDSTGDWVTELSDGSYSTEGPLGTKGVIKTTGSSIADYSDNDEADFPGAFSPRPHVVRHPAGRNQPESYELRNLKDTKQPVLLPKALTNRAGGFLENSNRFYQGTSKEDGTKDQARLPPPRKWSNPFVKSDSYKRADSSGNFMFKTDRNGPSKYEFRDSASEYAVDTPRAKAISSLQEADTSGSLPGATSTDNMIGKGHNCDVQRESSGLESTDDQPLGPSSSGDMRTPCEKRLVDEEYPIRYNNWWHGPVERQRKLTSASEASIKSKFEFELLPLDEAQRKHKRQRESGETDETDTGRDRIVRDGSFASSRGLPVSSPIQPPVPARVRGHHVAPNLSQDLSPDSIHSCGDAFQDTPSPFAATTREDDMTPTTASARRSLLRWGDLPIIPSSNRMGSTTTIKAGPSAQHRRLLFPVAQQSRRIESTQTVIRHIPPSESGPSFAAYMEVNISERAHHRRQMWFYTMLALSILLPFFAIPVLVGTFNESLAWLTEGEVRQLTMKQRNIIKYTFLSEFFIYSILAVSIIAFFTRR
ncbi:hypothetical protein AAE478_009643 [Parahypoxylon ruwenzoriense]